MVNPGDHGPSGLSIDLHRNIQHIAASSQRIGPLQSPPIGVADNLDVIGQLNPETDRVQGPGGIHRKVNGVLLLYLFLSHNRWFNRLRALV